MTAWVAGGNYTVGELVTYQGSEYKCLQANNDAAPNWDPIDWPGWLVVSRHVHHWPDGHRNRDSDRNRTATATATGTATATATGTATAYRNGYSDVHGVLRPPQPR